MHSSFLTLHSRSLPFSTEGNDGPGGGNEGEVAHSRRWDDAQSYLLQQGVCFYFPPKDLRLPLPCPDGVIYESISNLPRLLTTAGTSPSYHRQDQPLNITKSPLVYDIVLCATPNKYPEVLQKDTAHTGGELQTQRHPADALSKHRD